MSARGPAGGGLWVATLLRLLPRRFRERHGDEMSALALEMEHELGPRPGALRRLRLRAALAWDVLSRLRAEHSRSTAAGAPSRPSDLLAESARDVRVALKGLRRDPGFALVALVTLALSIGASAAVFSVVDAVLLRPLPYPDAERLVLLFNRYPALGVERGGQTPGDLHDYRQRTDVFDRIAAFGGTHNQTLTGSGPASRIATSSATDELFPLLGVRPTLGRLFGPGDDDSRAVISHGFWQSRFGGSPRALGAGLVVGGRTLTVIGVLPRDFALHAPSHLQLPRSIAVWIPIRRFLGSPSEPDRTAHWMTVVARLGPGVTLAQAQAQLDAVAAWQRRELPVRRQRDARIDVVAMHREIVAEARPTLLALFGAVGFVLLIGCANVSNLLLARSQRRRHEMALCAALGASRGRLLRQLLTESAVLAAVGGALGVLVARLGVGAILALRPDELPFVESIALDGRVLGFVSLVSIAATLAFGTLPGLVLSRAGLGSARPGAGGGRGSARLRSALVAAELALSMVLLVGAGLLLRSAASLADVTPGFRTGDVLSFAASPPSAVWKESRNGELSHALQSFYERAREALLALPGVETVGTIWPTPLDGSGGGYSTYTTSPEAADEQSQLASSQLVTPGYFETLGISILEGRALTLADGPDKLMIDERMAQKLWPGESPLGRRLRIGWWSGPVWGEVVGVVASVRSVDLRRPDPETVYRKAAVFSYAPQSFVVRSSGDPLALVESVRRALGALHSEVAIEQVATLASYERRQLAPIRFATLLLGAFAVTALVFAAVGVYGVTSVLAGERRREIGIRFALGARRSQVLALVLRQALVLIAIGLGAGLAGVAATSRLLSGYLFGVEPEDPVTLIGVALLLAGAAAAACARPALGAARVDPARCLRLE